MLIKSASIMKFVALANGIMSFIYFSLVFQRTSIPALIALAVSSAFFLLPIQSRLRKYFSKKTERNEEDTYYDNINKFKHYDLLNPVTKYMGESRLEGKSLAYAIRSCLIKKLSVMFINLNLSNMIIFSKKLPKMKLQK